MFWTIFLFLNLYSVEDDADFGLEKKTTKNSVITLQ